MRQIIFIAVGCAFVLSLVGCETFRGLGKDVENTGKTLEQALSKDKGGS